MMMLRRTDTERNMHRFYALGIMPTLFGEWMVIAEWGRIGAPGRMQWSTYSNEVAAIEALARRLADKKRRGYRSTAHTLVRSYLAGDQDLRVVGRQHDLVFVQSRHPRSQAPCAST